jgi:hypothetical protein
MERHVRVESAPPAPPARRRRGRRSLPLVTAPVLVLALAAVVVAGTGLQAIFLQGPADETLANAGLDCMTPPQAAHSDTNGPGRERPGPFGFPSQPPGVPSRRVRPVSRLRGRSDRARRPRSTHR